MPNVISTPLLASDDPTARLIQLINTANGTSWTTSDVVFGTPVVPTASNQITNTSVVITPTATSVFYGSITIYYNRIYGPSLGVIRVNPGSATTIYGALAAINTAMGTAITTNDVEDGPLPAPDGSGNVTVTLTFAPTSLLFYGGAVISLIQDWNANTANQLATLETTVAELVATEAGLTTTVIPYPDGTASIGTSPSAAHADHVHPANQGVSVSGLVATLVPFTVSGFSFAGGTITLLPNGTWYIGVEMWSGAIRILPRLGHRGWIPVAVVTTGASSVLTLSNISPVIPTTRIPRTQAKIDAGTAIKVVVMGSSLLASSGAATDWPGMVFGSGNELMYRLPTTVNVTYAAMNGTPNQYQLAQLGIAGSHTGNGNSNSGYPSTVTNALPMNSRSNMFVGVDLVVIGVLANGSDYYLQTVEAIARKLRQQGLEVIFVTDNPMTPNTSYSLMATTSGIYGNGNTIFAAADVYGCEIADTAAYVFEAYIRANGTGIYATSDPLNQATGLPAGVNTTPSCGQEVWARAVRSIFSTAVTTQVISGVAISPVAFTYNFSTGVSGWTANGSSTISTSGSNLVVTTTGNSQGVQATINQAINAGDNVTITYTATTTGTLSSMQLGTQHSGAWNTTAQAITANGSQQSQVFVANGSYSNFTALFYIGTSTAGSKLNITGLTITVQNRSIGELDNGNFSNGLTGWTLGTGATGSVTSGLATITNAVNVNLALSQVLGYIPPSSLVNISFTVGTVTGSWSVGLSNNGSWDPNGFIGSISSPGTYNVNYTNTGSGLTFYVWNNATTINTINISAITLSVSSINSYESVPNRTKDIRPLPPCRVVSDLHTPGDAFVILPAQELYVTSSNVNAGTLGTNPLGASSFANRFNPNTSLSANLLTLTAGKSAVLSAEFVNGLGLIHYRATTDTTNCVFTVSQNSSVLSTQTLTTPSSNGEFYLPLFTQANSPTGSASVIITVTSGTLKIAGLVALTADIDYLQPEDITYVGAWMPKENSASGLPGYPTNVAGSYCYAKCTGNRLSWLISGNPGSQNWDSWNGQTSLLAQNLGGTANIWEAAQLVGPNINHFIQCDVTVLDATNTNANGRSLHIGGALIINDR